jgi:hypothetical protein
MNAGCLCIKSCAWWSFRQPNSMANCRSCMAEGDRYGIETGTMGCLNSAAGRSRSNSTQGGRNHQILP